MFFRGFNPYDCVRRLFRLVIWHYPSQNCILACQVDRSEHRQGPVLVTGLVSFRPIDLGTVWIEIFVCLYLHPGIWDAIS